MAGSSLGHLARRGPIEIHICPAPIPNGTRAGTRRSRPAHLRRVQISNPLGAPALLAASP
jgi:hypothetical protein